MIPTAIRQFSAYFFRALSFAPPQLPPTGVDPQFTSPLSFFSSPKQLLLPRRRLSLRCRLARPLFPACQLPRLFCTSFSPNPFPLCFFLPRRASFNTDLFAVALPFFSARFFPAPSLLNPPSFPERAVPLRPTGCCQQVLPSGRAFLPTVSSEFLSQHVSSSE